MIKSQIMKKLLPFIVFFISVISCAQKTPIPTTTLQSAGIYNKGTDKIYVDKTLKQTSKANAAYYLEKELLGADLVPNDSNTGNYWQDRAYFKDTPIVRYIYKYFDVKDNKLAFAASVAEYKGQPNYIFDGTAFFANKQDKVSSKLCYETGKLNGEVAEYNEDGSFASRKLYKNGKPTGVIQDAKSLNQYFIGTWHSDIPTGVDWQQTVLVNIFKDDGTIDSYRNMFYVNDSQKRQTMDGSDSPFETFWLYKPSGDSSGSIEFYDKNGDLVQRSDVKIKDRNNVTFTINYTNPKYGSGEVQSYNLVRQ